MEGEHPRPHDESDSGRPGAKTPGAEERLRQVGNSYQVALEALLQGDLETAAGALLDSDGSPGGAPVDGGGAPGGSATGAESQLLRTLGSPLAAFLRSSRSGGPQPTNACSRR